MRFLGNDGQPMPPVHCGFDTMQSCDLDAGQTPAAVARRLNLAGAVTKSGHPWSPTAIRQVGVSVVYLGQIGLYISRAGGVRRPTRSVPRDQVRIIQGLHLAIIPQDLWDRVQVRIKQVPRSPNSKSTRYLSGLIVCGECGSKCHAVIGAYPWQGYSCRWRGKGADRCTSDRYLEVALLEEAVRAWVRAVAADPAVIQRAASRPPRRSGRNASGPPGPPRRSSGRSGSSSTSRNGSSRPCTPGEPRAAERAAGSGPGPAGGRPGAPGGRHPVGCHGRPPRGGACAAGHSGAG